MTYQATVKYDRRIIRKAAGHFWRRFIAWHGFAAIAVCLLGCIALLVTGDRSWTLGALGAVTFLLIVTSTSVYFVSLRRSLWKFERMQSKSVHFIFSQDRFSSVSDLGSSDISWRAIERIWRFPDLWLLFAGKTTYVTLPLADLDQATQAFIVDRVAQHGGRIN